MKKFLWLITAVLILFVGCFIDANCVDFQNLLRDKFSFSVKTQQTKTN
ncbi:hypothetical protein G5B00_17680 [Parapedobacter sp. SGR-10]|nr:hypothetical protein [Parapedobacter sp. SGR-10]NGF58332.1 hypothetical protein [Parapedobacter sp. SGR-10]